VYPSSVCSKSGENAISAGSMSQGYQDATLSTPYFICAASSLLLSSLPRSISWEISLETWIRISYDVPTHDLECACIHDYPIYTCFMIRYKFKGTAMPRIIYKIDHNASMRLPANKMEVIMKPTSHCMSVQAIHHIIGDCPQAQSQYYHV